MSYRFMRILVMFDLPVTTSVDLRAYTHFRKFLIKSGFIMLQESVYTKLALNNTVAEAVLMSIRKNKPGKGLVQMLTITEKQFARMELVVGSVNSEFVDSDERLVIL
ncbi:MAG: CRISPR-associated endonuclease Cas2 [Acidaminococcaceae bacterium]